MKDDIIWYIIAMIILALLYILSLNYITKDCTTSLINDELSVSGNKIGELNGK